MVTLYSDVQRQEGMFQGAPNEDIVQNLLT